MQNNGIKTIFRILDMNFGWIFSPMMKTVSLCNNEGCDARSGVLTNGGSAIDGRWALKTWRLAPQTGGRLEVCPKYRREIGGWPPTQAGDGRLKPGSR